MGKIKIFCFIITLAFIVTGCQKAPQAFHDHQVVAATLHNRRIHVEVVNTQASMAQGLSDRDVIGSDGMMFFLGNDTHPEFWMHRMRFALDMVWLQNNQVVDMTESIPAPAPNTPDQDLPVYAPKTAANMVLEIPAGTARTWQLHTGDTLTFH